MILLIRLKAKRDKYTINQRHKVTVIMGLCEYYPTSPYSKIKKINIQLKHTVIVCCMLDKFWMILLKTII